MHVLDQGPQNAQKVPEDSTVAVTYEGRFVNPDGSDGNIFDSSLKGGVEKPFIFNLGEGKVIKGWETAIPMLKKG